MSDTQPPKPLTSDEIADLKAKAKRGSQAYLPSTILRLIDMVERRDVALTAVRDMPISEQDNMLVANMRKVASEALASTEPTK